MTTTRTARADGAVAPYFRHDKVKKASGRVGVSPRTRKAGRASRVRGAIATPGAAASHENYICREDGVERIDGIPSVVSNISPDMEERKAFWRKVEKAERLGGLIQNRITAELPYEATPDERVAIAQGFCEHAFGSRGLPYTCAIHVPGTQSDARNFHMHIDYYKRPCTKLDDGSWDFEKKATKRNADRLTASREWIRALRHAYVNVVNRVMETARKATRYFAETYRHWGLPESEATHQGQWTKGKTIADKEFQKTVAHMPKTEQRIAVLEREVASRRRRLKRDTLKRNEVKEAERLTERQRNFLQQLEDRRDATMDEIVALNSERIALLKRKNGEDDAWRRKDEDRMLTPAQLRMVLAARLEAARRAPGRQRVRSSS